MDASLDLDKLLGGAPWLSVLGTFHLTLFLLLPQPCSLEDGALS